MRGYRRYNEIRKMKTCKCCGKELPESEFYKDKNLADGLKYYCKECWRAKCRVYQGSKKKAEVESRPLRSVKSLQDYTPRELLEEPHRRGYGWAKDTIYYEERKIRFVNL